MKPSWYQRWFGYTPEYQRITWGLLAEIALALIVVLVGLAIIGALAYAVFR